MCWDKVSDREWPIMTGYIGTGSHIILFPFQHTHACTVNVVIYVCVHFPLFEEMINFAWI